MPRVRRRGHAVHSDLVLIPPPETLQDCLAAVGAASDIDLLRAQEYLGKHPPKDLPGQELDYLIDRELRRRTRERAQQSAPAAQWPRASEKRPAIDIGETRGKR